MSEMTRLYTKNLLLNIFLTTLLLLATLFAWSGISRQIPEGEGFIYFAPPYQLIESNGKLINPISSFDNFAKIYTFIFEKLYQGNLFPYMVGLLIGILLLNTIVFLSLKSITKNSWLAFIATLIFGINFQSNYQFYARGHIHWYLQRVPEVIPMILSMSLLYKFNNSQKIKFYFFSIILFVISILTSHYSFLFLPLFIVFLPINSILSKSKNNKKILLSLLYTLPFIIVNYFFLSATSLGPEVISSGRTLGEFVYQTKDIIQKIFFQLTTITIPIDITINLSKSFKIPQQTFILKSIPFIIGFYILTFLYFYKLKIKYLGFLISVFIGLLGTLFLNIYLGRVANIYNEIIEGRYYFIPNLYIGIIIATLIVHLPIKKKYIYIIPLSIIWVTLNTSHIHKKMQHSQYQYTAGIKLLRYLDTAKERFPPNSLVLLPTPLMPLGPDFLKKYYSGEDTKFLFIHSKWIQEVPQDFDVNKIFAFDYNEEYKRGGSADLKNIKVIDVSKIYRQKYIASERDSMID